MFFYFIKRKAIYVLSFIFVLFINGYCSGETVRPSASLTFPLVNDDKYVKSDSDGYNYFYNNDRLTKIESSHNSITFDYDKDGDIIKETMSDGSFWSIEYNQDKTQSIDTYYDKTGTIESIFYSTYNNNGLLIKVMRDFENDGKINNKLTYEYNDDNSIMKEHYFFPDGDDYIEVSFIDYIYKKNDDNLIIQMTVELVTQGGNRENLYETSFSWSSASEIIDNNNSTPEVDEEGGGCFITTLRKKSYKITCCIEILHKMYLVLTDFVE